MGFEGLSDSKNDVRSTMKTTIRRIRLIAFSEKLVQKVFPHLNVRLTISTDVRQKWMYG